MAARTLASEDMLLEKNKLLPGFSGMRFQASLDSGTARTCAIFLGLFVLCASNIGIDNELSILLLLISLLAYARVDFNFIRVQVYKKELSLKKGLLMFRWRTQVVLPMAQLLSARNMSETPVG